MITRYGTWPKTRPLPIVLTSLNGTSRSSTPPVIRSAAPSDMPSVPSVTISGGTRAWAVRTPFSAPHARPASSAPPRPTKIVTQLPPPSLFIALTATTPLNTSTAPTDRSMPAVMITNVMPVASTSRTAASVAMLRAFEADTKLSYSSTEKARMSATRISPIHVLDPVTKRCHHGTRSVVGSSGSSVSSSATVSRASAPVSLIASAPAGSRQRPWSSTDALSCRLLVAQRAGHRPDDVLHRHLAAPEPRHALAEAQHLDAVGDLEDLGHVVADEHDREAALAHAEDEVEDVARLHDAERGGRLVHEDDLARPRHRAADRDALALAAGHRRDRRGRVLQADAEALERLVGAAVHRGVVEEAELAEQPAARDLAAEEQVCRRVELGREREVLVDGLDPERARLERRADRHLAALEEDLARVRRLHAGERLDERRLAGAVVAAERHDLSRVDGEARAAQRADAPEALDEAAGLEQRLGHGQALLPAGTGIGGRASALSKTPAATPASSAAPRQPASTTGGCSSGPRRAAFAARNASSRAQPPVTTRRRRGPATDSMWASSDSAPVTAASTAARQMRSGATSAGRATGRRSSERRASSSAGTSPGAVASAPASSSGRPASPAPRASRTSPSARPDHRPPRRAWRSAATCQPTLTSPATAASIASGPSGGATTRTSASAVPHESSTSPGATTPTPTPAARWSWPATVSAAPRASASAPGATVPAGVPARTGSGSRSSGIPAHASASANGAFASRSKRPVRDASDSSVTSSPPSPRTTHSPTLSQRRAARTAGRLATIQRSFGAVHSALTGRPVVRVNRSAPRSSPRRRASS